MTRKILLVDSDQTLLKKLGRRLKKEQFAVITSADGATALEVAIVGKPDLVITNYHLPIFSGERLRAFLRNNPTTYHIPIIFLVDTDRGKDTTLASIGPDPSLVKPFRWEDIKPKIHQAFSQAEQEEDEDRIKKVGSGVEGNLQEVSLVDLLQIFSLNRRTGILTLSHGDEEGTVYLNNGEVVSTVHGEINGEKALYRILRWKDGTFHYLPDQFTISRNISRPIDALLMEGMRQLDEWDSLQAKMPPGSSVLKMNKNQEELPRDLRPVTEEVLLLLEFYSSVDDIIEKSKHTDYEVCKSILGLIQKGILSGIEERRAVKRDETPLVTAEQALSIRKVMGSEDGGSSGPEWGKILLFSSTPELVKQFLAEAGNLDEFRLSRDNFSNQEILNTSFGSLGALEISDKTRLQLFVLPSGLTARPLWKPFSEGSVGAILLTARDNGDREDLAMVTEFVKNSLKHPLVHREVDTRREIKLSASDVFKDLFTLLLEEETEYEGNNT
jgi:CheY-like chemotaxis protein